MRAMIFALALVAAGCGDVAPCKSGTVLLTIDVGASAPDTVQFVVSLDGKPGPEQSLAWPAGATHGTVEVDFGAYPAGHSFEVAVTARRGGSTVGSADSGKVTLAGGCQAVSLAIGGAQSDLGVDAATGDSAVPMVDGALGDAAAMVDGSVADLVTSSVDGAGCGGLNQPCCSGQCTAINTVCSGGTCTCPSNDLVCSNRCVDPKSDPMNCSGCGIQCGAMNVCSNGTCALVCGSGLMACNGACVNVTSDANNCGSCGHACGANATCSSSTCLCMTGYTQCNGVCTTTASDTNNLLRVRHAVRDGPELQLRPVHVPRRRCHVQRRMRQPGERHEQLRQLRPPVSDGRNVPFGRLRVPRRLHELRRLLLEPHQRSEPLRHVRHGLRRQRGLQPGHVHDVLSDGDDRVQPVLRQHADRRQQLR